MIDDILREILTRSEIQNKDNEEKYLDLLEEERRRNNFTLKRLNKEKKGAPKKLTNRFPYKSHLLDSLYFGEILLGDRSVAYFDKRVKIDPKDLSTLFYIRAVRNSSSTWHDPLLREIFNRRKLFSKSYDKKLNYVGMFNSLGNNKHIIEKFGKQLVYDKHVPQKFSILTDFKGKKPKKKGNSNLR